MTEREAMFIHDCFINGFNLVSDNKFAFKRYSGLVDKALERQISRKAVKGEILTYPGAETEVTEMSCPVCGDKVLIAECNREHLEKRIRYCSCCGQAFDWSDVQ